jgi:hypothetical protein
MNAKAKGRQNTKRSMPVNLVPALYSAAAMAMLAEIAGRASMGMRVGRDHATLAKSAQTGRRISG